MFGSIILQLEEIEWDNCTLDLNVDVAFKGRVDHDPDSGIFDELTVESITVETVRINLSTDEHGEPIELSHRAKEIQTHVQETQFYKIAGEIEEAYSNGR